jgi:S-adenosylmethionine hydrolase
VDKITKISHTYSDVGIADLFAVFNFNEFLEIGMNGGKASQLLGIKNHTPITINFL